MNRFVLISSILSSVLVVSAQNHSLVLINKSKKPIKVITTSESCGMFLENPRNFCQKEMQTIAPGMQSDNLWGAANSDAQQFELWVLYDTIWYKAQAEISTEQVLVEFFEPESTEAQSAIPQFEKSIKNQ